MQPSSIKKPRPLFLIWALILLASTAAIVAFNVGVKRHVDEVRRRNPQTYFKAAVASLRIGDHMGASANLEKGIACAPESPETHQSAGEVYFQMKQWESAVASFDRAMGLGGKHGDVPTNKLWALIELGRYKEAVEFGTKSIDAGYSAPRINRHIAEALLRDGKGTMAIRYLEEALEENPNDLYVLSVLERCYEEDGDAAGAERTASRLEEAQRSIGELD